jgi:hypothetical protein
LIEGRPLEVRPSRNLQPAETPVSSETLKTGTDGVTWRYS